MKKILSIFWLGVFTLATANAAQVGTVIVDEASVYEYPQAGSAVLSTLSKDASIAVSNLPTEGFYKVRLPNGELGWVSGNDVFVGAKSAPAPTPKARTRAKPEGLPDANSLDSLREEDEDGAPKKKKKKMARDQNFGESEEEFAGDSSRILLMAGVQYPSYNGLAGPGRYSQIDGLRPGYGGVLEFQFAMSKHWHWAGRAEFNFAKADSQNIGSGKTQTLKQSSIPLQVGLNFSPITTRGFRLGLGAYAGVVLSSNTTVSQTSSALSEQVEYSSYDPTALGVVQMSFGLGAHLGLIVEGGYRYQKTGQFEASSRFGGIPALSIYYSGPVGHLGFEFKF